VAKASASRELALLRLVAQGLAGPRLDSPHAVAQRLLCMQAQDYWSGLASVAVRTGGGLDQAEAAFDAGLIVRSWPLRGTVHLLAAEDLTWLRELLAPRQLNAARLRAAREGLDAELLDKAASVATEAIAAGGPRSRTELNKAWAAAGIDASGQRSYHVIWHLAHLGSLVFGPTHNGQQLFVSAAQWLPPSPRIDREAGLRRLALRYFAGHGPATVADLARWANLTLTDARQSVAAARGELATFEIDAAEYLLGTETEDVLAGCRREAEAVFALPHFDELLLGYRDRSSTLPLERDLNVFANRNGVPAPTIIYRGQVIATWKRPRKGSSAAVETTAVAAASAAVLGRGAAKAAEISGR
jgi:hypothetical protein